jgi:hypothetical protein
MADGREETINKKIEELDAPIQDGELSDADIEKVAGGGHHNTLISGAPNCG